MKHNYIKNMLAALLLLCSTVASANNPVVPADETYTLTYVVDGETYQTATLAAGAAINLPAGPAKEGYKFVKWNLETAVPIDIASNADAMLYTNAPCTDTRYGDQFTSWQVLFDDNAGTFFHSEYANKESADGLDHYLRVDMGEGKSIMNFTFTYTNRNTNSYINAPKTMVVEGSNEADGEYVELATLTNLSSTDSDVYNSQVIGNGTAYRYIRYRVTETHYNQKVYEHPFFFIAEFGMADTAIPTTMPAADFSLVAVYKELFGSCGDNATWSLNDGVLTIGGTGDMFIYSSTYNAPWYEYRGDITTVIIEDGVTGIGEFAFFDCVKLADVTIPNSVTSIGNDAFAGCSALTSIEIPSSVTSIGNSAFWNCSNLTSITSLATTPATLGTNVFNGIGADAVLTVPAEAVAAYEADDYWNVIPTIEANFTWSYADGVLTIGGTGAMPDYANADATPWKDYSTAITTIVVGEGITHIGNNAFRAFEAATSATLPSTLTSIGNDAFYGCTNLADVEIPTGVTTIGVEAFCRCSSLTSVEIPAGITTIPQGAFSRTGLTSVTVPEGVTSIGAWAFDVCPNLAEVSLPSTLTSIGNNAFENSTILASITIPNSVTNIGGGAFSGCSALTSITIPNSVTSIGNYTFESCTGLTSITIPNSVTSIGQRAFIGCSNLTEITIPNSVTSIGGEAFRDCSALTSITIPNSVTSIGVCVFEDCTGLTSIEIPNSVTSIGSSAFNGCTGLTSVTIGNGVTSIGNFAFYYCTGLTSITIPNSVTSIGDNAFSNCNSLTSVTIGNSVTSIGSSAFYKCTGLTEITIPNSVTSIGDEAFRECSALTSITIPNGVTSIGGETFYYCSALTSVTIGNSVTSIGDNAFSNCNSLTSVTIGNSVTTIGDFAFYGCSALTEITIPNSVTSIGDEAFRGCTGLTSIVVDDGNSVYDSREGCNAIIETATNTLIRGSGNTIIPNSVTTIGDYALEGCTSLTEITIPGSVTSIGEGAFSLCRGLTSITIPNSVTSIGGLAFAGCSALTSITIPNSVTEIGWWAFHACNYLTDIYFASNPTIDDSKIPSTTTCHLTLTDSDVADFNTANANRYADASYTRTISEGKYGTIMLPFAPDEASLQNYAFYTLKEAGDGYIRFEEVAAPEANTPYLYTLRAGAENTAITGGETTIAADIANGTVGSWDLVGSFTNQTIDCTTGNYYAYSAARNEINRITKTLTVSPYRAYLKSTAAQNSNLRVFIGGTTGVTEISPDDIEGFDGGAVYDLYGRPVSEPAKGGVYIIDGKKVVW